MAFEKITRGIDQVNRRLGEAVAWLGLAMVLLTTADVLMRKLLNTGAVWVQELEWHLFGVLFLLSAGYALLMNSHVRVDVFYARMTTRSKAWIDLLGTLFMLFPVCALVIWSSHNFIINSWNFREVSPDPGGLPARYLIKAMIPIGFAFLALQGVSEALKNFAVLMGEEPRP